MTRSSAYASLSVEAGPNVGGIKTPFRIIGIAFVVDQKGRGSRTIMRYPTLPSHPDDADDVFFRLSQRQLSKLFRPKPSLCEHPVTLAVGSTIFCCRAILLEDAINDDPNGTVEEHIELFSVVVALAPRERGPVVPITGWFEDQASTEKTDDADKTERDKGHEGDDEVSGKTSPSFKTVRRVHLSLARLCRVLEREEKRCNYVSQQSSRYLELRKQVRAEAAAVPSPTSVSSTKPAHIRRTSTFSSIFEKDSANQVTSIPQTSQTSAQQQQQQAKNAAKARQNEEMEQEILEMFMASEPSSSRDYNPMHRGNLARELVQFHHALARNDYNFPPSPSLLLTGRDGIVHINGHIAVAVEAVSPRIIQEQEVRPYETLLFPHASPKELLKSLAGYGSSASRRLQQVLLTVNPQKSLIDIAADANLSLQSSMEIAKYLVSKSAAIVAPVISRNCRFACHDIQQLHDIALPFAQAFGAELDLFRLVSFITESNWTLNQTIHHLLTSTDGYVLRLRFHLSNVAAKLSSNEAPEGTPEGPPLGSDAMSPGVSRDHNNNNNSSNNVASMGGLEDTLFQLTVWLCSHRVLVHILEYLVSATPASSSSANTDDNNTMEQKMAEKDLSSDDALFREMFDMECLTGTISIPACSWRIGIDVPRLRSFAERHPLIRVVRRPFQVGDDWGRLFD